MDIFFSVRSHQGRIRATNEDNLFADGMMLLPRFRDKAFSFDAITQAPVLLAVCDGMGGEDSGEVASETAVKKLAEMETVIKNTSPEKLSETVQAYIDNVDLNLKICGKRMGTTLALAVITENRLSCFNVGDTRIYCMKAGKLMQMTHDHTFGAEMARKNRINIDQARNCKNGKKLTRCIGIGDHNSAEELTVNREKCRLMICSDGLTDMVSASEIEKILAGTTHTSDAAEQCMQSALKHGGKDNITVIVADIPSKSLTEILNTFKNRRFFK